MILRAKLSSAEWLVLVFALLAAHGFWFHEQHYPSLYDAAQYIRIAGAFLDHGLFQLFADAETRTYGYPFFLSLIYRITIPLGLNSDFVVFEVQLLLYLCTAFFLRVTLIPFSLFASRIVFCGLLANYYVLIYTPVTLTESLSITLLVFIAACWLEFYRRDTQRWILIVGSLAVGYILMVRPGNMFVVATWIIALIIIILRKRFSAGRIALLSACVAVALALPALPQLLNNINFFNKFTPLCALDLGRLQQIGGIMNLKYASSAQPPPNAFVYYENPFSAGTRIDGNAPWRWYIDYPWRGVLTTALHIFNLTDQDLLFTYSRDLHPWYRVPLGIINYAVVALGLMGLVMFGCRVVKQKQAVAIDALLVLLVLLATYLGIYALTQVEMRYGSVLLLVLFPLAGYAAIQIWSSRNPRWIAIAFLVVVIYILAAFMLSNWVREQAPMIRKARLASGTISQPHPVYP